jgi:hypothetical protein
MTRHPIGTKARTGERCPESGAWRPGNEDTTGSFAEHNVMPPYAGKAVVWTLVRYA